MKVLGIETSCDETGIALYDTEQGLLAHALYSQIDLHAQYGGVVPELASRDHVRKALPLIESVLKSANCTKNDLDGIAYTQGPGLVGALMVGAALAKGLGFVLNIPTVGVHHMEGHLLAPFLDPSVQVKPPFVALLVSGGHTQLIHVKALGEYELLGETIDDAVGEAFDKTAKIMGLPYPGGPNIEKLAKQGTSGKFKLPRPMTDRPGLDFSFSGLKTATMTALAKAAQVNQLHQLKDIDLQLKADIALAFQEAVIDTLRIKCQRALDQTGLNQLVIAGGVSANQSLRTEFDAMAKKKNYQVIYPQQAFCTDNGAMIAYAGALRLQTGLSSDQAIQVLPRWPLKQLQKISSNA